MRTSRASIALGALAAVLAAGLPALAQERPESILPPGFGDPVVPAPAPRQSAAPRPLAPGPVPGASPSSPGALPSASSSATPSPTGTPTPLPTVLAEMPDYARRPLAFVGVESGRVRADAFGSADGQMVERLMRRLDTPIPSRWLEIGLRRLLVARVQTPRRVNGANFAAERAWLLLRMGEAPAARSVVQGVDLGNFTPKLMQVALQAWLANGDPAGTCGIADVAVTRDPERAWTLARGMCAGISGEGAKASAVFAAARRQRVARGIDLQLAQKVAGAGGNARRAVNPDFTGVQQLTAWRQGLALATGVEVSADLLATVGPQVLSWRATSPLLTASQRAVPAVSAAARGVISNAALVDLYASLDEQEDASAPLLGTANQLRTAYSAGSASERLAALTSLWTEPQDALARHGRLVLTARAAARIPVGVEGADADRLVAAMLTAGLDRSAGRWTGHVAEGSDAWAMLALADPEPRATLSGSSVAGFADGRKRQMFFAAAAGLGRMSDPATEATAEALQVRIGAQNAWTRALERAIVEDQPGTVLLLCAIGMQTADWGGVPPETLYLVTRALRATGQGGLARMIAAEAISRL